MENWGGDSKTNHRLKNVGVVVRGSHRLSVACLFLEIPGKHPRRPPVDRRGGAEAAPS